MATSIIQTIKTLFTLLLFLFTSLLFLKAALTECNCQLIVTASQVIENEPVRCESRAMA
ncbi:MAG TPA: hypothetical protein V6D18_04650 [Thermosynechococcaceae cyanobacterium]